MIPKWGWPVAVAIATVCYEVNRHGHGYISFIAVTTLTRLIVTRTMKDESEQYRWIAAFFVAFVGTLGYGLLANVLWPDRISIDGPLDLDDDL